MGRAIGTAAAALVLLSGCSGSGASTPAEGEAPAAPATVASGTAAWTIVLTNAELGPSGIGIALHPTRAPILIAADADASLEVCPADPVGGPADPHLASFGRRWTECRLLGSEAITLPATDGRTHVGIRVVTADGNGGTVRQLRMRWRCPDDYFLLQDPSMTIPLPSPRCAAGVAREGR